ncbi:hypothetical protein HELRODRAFT_166862 [Helobdella robusta]|uniref:Endonuclease/exonuclease/phosphatase domain-containing protein n=1 Tax=Helobdella robusta TaxID=6412 RepID=T1EYN4_HELRO|nr:hypothetical protein HELRODRAFT_166862 [Helobdella robusta]ESO11813.1 hypothetical protein HELRODRAFT_166862 [Helobdella robusta]
MFFADWRRNRWSMNHYNNNSSISVNSSTPVAIYRHHQKPIYQLREPQDREGQETRKAGPLGGRVAIILKDSYRSTKIDIKFNPKTFECLCVSSLPFCSNKISWVSIYRPGSSQITSTFFDEFRQLLKKLTELGGQVVIMGDINIHLEYQTEAHAVQLTSLLTMFGYLPHVQTPTHNKGGLLDVIITRFEFRVHNIIVDPPIISDHSLLYGLLDIELPKTTCLVNKKVRNFKRINIDKLKDALSTTDLSTHKKFVGRNIDELFDICDTLCELMNKYAPQREIRIRIKSTPWFDDDCHKIKRCVRRLERVYRRTRDHSDLIR